MLSTKIYFPSPLMILKPLTMNYLHSSLAMKIAKVISPLHIHCIARHVHSIMIVYIYMMLSK